MKKKYLSAILAVVALMAILLFTSGEKTEKAGDDALTGEKSASTGIWLNGRKISVEIAETEKQREDGLSRRQNLCSNCGMLFVFPDKEMQVFWMKEMLFDLDIIWIAGNKIIGISKNVSHQLGAREIVRSIAPADKVLEINAGKSGEWGLAVGGKVEF
jgi:uncharacterized membrane protein (UPF0127 family)